MNILITGANGQLGRTIRDVSRGYGHRCIFTSLNAGEDTAALDVTDADAVRAMMKADAVDVVINCAGYTDVPKAEYEEAEARKLNVDGPSVLASAAKETGAVLIHFSTDYVYDGKANTPYSETCRPNPLNIYAKTKAEGDEVVMNSGCKYLIFRISWLYSCYGNNFFKTIEHKTSTMSSINVVEDQVGTPTYAADIAQAIFLIIDDGKLDRTGLYNYSNEGVCSWYDFAEAINRGFGYTCDIQPCRTCDYPSNVIRPAYSVLEKALFKETFGYEVPHWEDSLAVCIQEFSAKMSES